MLDSLFDLKGKVALVAGAGGLGTAMAQALAAAGADVICGDANPKNAAAAAALAGKLGRKSAALTFDIMERASIEKLVDDALAQMGRLDILVNSVGIARMGPAVDLSPEDWNAVITAFLSGVFWTCQLVARKAMIDRLHVKVQHGVHHISLIDPGIL